MSSTPATKTTLFPELSGGYAGPGGAGEVPEVAAAPADPAPELAVSVMPLPSPPATRKLKAQSHPAILPSGVLSGADLPCADGVRAG